MMEDRRGDFEIVIDGQRFDLVRVNEKTLDALMAVVRAIGDFFEKYGADEVEP